MAASDNRISVTSAHVFVAVDGLFDMLVFESTFQFITKPLTIMLLCCRSSSRKGIVVLRIATSFVLILTLSTSALGTEWARKLFSEFNHEFGTVARAAKAEHTFEMVNPFKETVHIASVRASCGCSTPTIVKDTLQSWEKGGIHVRYNTRTFTGKKGATITVVIDKPFYAEVQLKVKGYIRSDVVFHPGVVSFDSIEVGTPATRKVSVNYAGRPDWQIMDVQSANTYFEVELDETRRGSGRVDYELLVRTKDSMPAGFFNDQLIIVTNDVRATRVPLRVEGNVVPGLTVSPASLFLGIVKPGDTVTKTLVVRGRKPFKVTKIDCEDGCFEFKPSEESKQMHLIPIVFTAPDPGKVTQDIRIETNLGGGAAASCLATATVQD